MPEMDESAAGNDVLRPPKFDTDWNIAIAVGAEAGLPLRVAAALETLQAALADWGTSEADMPQLRCADVQTCNGYHRPMPCGSNGCDKHVCNGHASCHFNWFLTTPVE
jgi:hypothetical protein